MPPLQPQEELSTLVEWSSTFAGDRNEVTQSSVYRGNILDHLMKEYDDASGYDFSTISHIPNLSAAGHGAADVSGPKEYSLHVVGLLLLQRSTNCTHSSCPPQWGPVSTVFFGQAGQVDPLVGWRSCY